MDTYQGFSITIRTSDGKLQRRKHVRGFTYEYPTLTIRTIDDKEEVIHDVVQTLSGDFYSS